MGYSSFSYDDWNTHTTTTAAKPASAIFTKTSLDDSINPANLVDKPREARDSAANPNSTPIIIGLDFTGSMGQIPAYMIKQGLGDLFEQIYDRKPVPDPQVLFCGIGDVDYDRAPFQVGQFESGCTELVNGLATFWLGGCGGGGNQVESYNIPYYFAANHTVCDNYIKRKRKGYIFTIGDEDPPEYLTPEQVKSVFGYTPESKMKFSDIIAQVKHTYVPYHIIVEEGSHVRHYGINNVVAKWSEVLGQNVIVLSDHKKLSEVIVSILQVENGVAAADVVKTWSGDTQLVVSKAVNGMVVANNPGKLYKF